MTNNTRFCEQQIRERAYESGEPGTLFDRRCAAGSSGFADGGLECLFFGSGATL